MKLKKQHLFLIVNALIGILKKYLLLARRIPKLSRNSINSNDEIVVSLTSYGRRVSSTVYYTLLSIFQQSLRPNRIILWLDNENWNDQNIPLKLRKLQENGLEIKYTTDIKSYKKLIPTLKLCPDNIIITVDDDVIYSSNLIANLYSAYSLEPNQIHCTYAKYIPIKKDEFKEYKQWKVVTTDDSENVFPIGVGGVLYPPNSLAKEVTNSKLFLKLCPLADDIWFWFMAKLNGTGHHHVYSSQSYYSFDALFQAFHRGTALTHSNVGNNNNDLQLEAVIEYFKKFSNYNIEEF